MYAVNLFKTIELFHWDSIRFMDESQLSTFYGLWSMHDSLVAKERFDTLQQSFRKRNLESLCVEYQYTRCVDIDAEKHESLVKDIYVVLDNHYKVAKEINNETRLILLYRMDRRTHDVKVSEATGGQIKIEMNPQLPAELRKISEDSTATFNEQMRYTNLVIWSQKKFKGEDTSIYNQYEINPLNAIDHAKEVLERHASGGYLTSMDEFAPANVAGIMLLFYEDLLDSDNLHFCKDVVETCISASSHVTQISDGLEICVNTLPILIRKFPDERSKYVNQFAEILCNHYALGSNRVCDYAIKCLSKNNDGVLLNQVIANYIAVVSGRSKSIATLQPLAESDIVKLDNFDLESLEVLFELIPNRSEDKLYMLLVNYMLPRFAETLRREDNHSSTKIYDRRIYLYKAIADYALQLSSECMQAFLTPFIEHLDCDSNSVDFIGQFIAAEHELQKTSAFWTVWQILYDTVVKNCSGYNDSVLQTYLMANDLFTPRAREWHSFDHNSFWLYDNIVRDRGNSAATIYSIARNMNYIASRYVENGIEWLYEIVSKYPEIKLRDRESNTIFYMERFIGGFVRKNRSDIRKNKKQKNLLVTILTFMVERNSVQAYMLRDMIA